MTLLVVGDGIREEAETLVEALSGHPEFEFKLALVEIRVFGLDDGRRLVVPSVSLKTEEVVRSIVRIEHGEIVVAPPPVPPCPRQPLTEQVFLDRLRESQSEQHVEVARRLLELIQEPLQPVWAMGSLTVKMHDPGGSGRMLSLLTVPVQGQASTYLPWLRDQLTGLRWNSDDVEAVLSEYGKLLEGFRSRRTKDGVLFDLTVIRGKEPEFIDRLLDVAKFIQQRVGDT